MMAGTGIDSAEFRSGQKRQWDSAATGWRKWSRLIDDASARISERLVELAGVREGSRVLDVAAGYGEPSLTAARIAGSQGSVVATDISAEMLAYGRERAAEAGVESIEFVEADAAGLDYPPGSFDAAISRWGIIFEPDGEAAAERVRGFLEPGSRMAISSWGPPERVPFLGVPVRTVIDRLGVTPPPPGTPGPLSRPTPAAIGGLLEGGGFGDIEVEEEIVVFEFGSPEEFTTFVREIAPPVTALMADRPQEVQDETWGAIGEAIAESAASDGGIRTENLVLMASGAA